MSEETVFRRATPDDAQAIATVAIALIAELGEASGLPGGMSAETIAARIGGYGDRGAMFVCVCDDRVCGFAALEPDPQEKGAVMGVWLLPGARRKGIGRELALMALDFARGAAYSRVCGTLPPGNEAALSFFSEIGALAQVVGQGMQYELPL